MNEPVKRGRKKKLDKLTSEDYKQITAWSGDGLSESQIAVLLGCSLSTIAREKRSNDKFDTAIKKGRYKAVQLVANKVFQNAMEGKETSAIFFLKNRAPDQWADRQEVNHNLDLAGILSNANSRILDVRPDEPGEQLNLQDARERTEANARTNAQDDQDEHINNSDGVPS
jgi:hypothetical protein